MDGMGKMVEMKMDGGREMYPITTYHKVLYAYMLSYVVAASLWVQGARVADSYGVTKGKADDRTLLL